MEVISKGEGEAEYAVIGSVHGDEPAGREAIKQVLAKNYSYAKPVKFVIANEEALAQNERFLDSDLNRSFPGDPESESREERLAAEILEEVGDSRVLDIHTTRSFDRPFATTRSFDNPEMEIIKASGAEYALSFEEENGSLTDYVNGIVVEAGLQQTDQAMDNAVEVIENFLAYFGIIEREFRESQPEMFIHFEKVEGNWEFLAENFQKVEEGEIYARRGNQELAAN
ncbi:MAG: succinylglutamate desuccinylase/aspartoacylase family protein [Candidatus Nanohaloarchaea archaeon]